MITKVTGDDRLHLLKLLSKAAFCACGEPAVVLYKADGKDRHGERFSFRWPRCGGCPGTRYTQGIYIQARPLEREHRHILQLLGDEQAFLAALRLGYRPLSYDQYGLQMDGHVDIDLEDWDSDGA